jgi:translation initiation factor IF-2
MTDKAITKTKVVSLVREINRSKEDIIDYLSSIGIEKVSINTSLEPDIVVKVYSHFKRDIEEKEKHVKKIVDFVKTNKVEIFEADERIKKDDYDRRHKEEEQRLRKIIEEQQKRIEDEKRKQELLAFIEREKAIKAEQEKEKKKKEELDKYYEKKRKAKIEAKQQAAEKLNAVKGERKPEGKTVEGKTVEGKTVESKTVEGKTVESKTVESKTVESKTVEGKTVEGKTVEGKTVEGKTVEGKTVEGKTVEGKSVEGKSVKKFGEKGSKQEYRKPERDFGRGNTSQGNTSQGNTSQRSTYQGNATAGSQFRPASTFKKYPSSSGKPFDPKHRTFSRDPQRKPETKPDNRGIVRPVFDKSGKGKFEKVTIKDTRVFKKNDRKDFRSRSSAIPLKGAIVPVKDAKKMPDKSTDKKKFKSESDYDKKKKKFVKGAKTKEFSQKEIDEAIRDTFARIDDESGASARSIARKRKKKERIEHEKIMAEIKESRKNVINVTEFLSTVELANLMNIEPTELIKKCFDLGLMVSINQRLEKDLIVLLAEEFGFKIEFQDEYKEDVLKEEEDIAELMVPRPPVVTVMGHVDHGKTSLLDYVRKANVVAGEAGGITQHIGAYKVRIDSGREIAFLDTPGHEAFTAMRARGGQAADIVVLVVAADDSVMPQTVEAINHALAASVPIVIAINKVDKPDSNIQRIKQQLADKNILVEEWGGKYQCVEISAKFGQNIDTLLQKILLEAEMLDLKANPKREARGVVLESKLDKGKGTVATVLVQKGTLRVGDNFIAGIFSGRVKAMFDEREKKIEIAGPSTPVQILGFDGTPQAGDTFIVMKSEGEVKEIALKRQQLKREQDFRQVKFTTLDDISAQIKQGKAVELNIILKTDVDGSAEALADSLHKLSNKEATIKVIHKAVGQITESDVLLAEASNAIIIGFNIRPNLNARKLAEKNSVDIRIHTIIYKVIDEVKQALEGMLEPEIKEEISATIEVRQVFKVPKIGNIAGCYVQDGKINRNNKVRLLRDGFEIYDGTISSLRRIKDDAREVESGYECGIGLENFSDIKIGDIIEGYRLVETKRKLETA